jgi:hypothetical protein
MVLVPQLPAVCSDHLSDRHLVASHHPVLSGSAVRRPCMAVLFLHQVPPHCAAVLESSDMQGVRVRLQPRNCR